MDPKKIDEFVVVTKSTREIAQYYLTLSKGVVSVAINLLYEDVGKDADDDVLFVSQTSASAGATSTSTTSNEKKELTILEWNIQGLLDDYLKLRTSAIIHIIKSKSPDIIMLQEVIDETYDQLFISLMDTYEAYSSPELLCSESMGYFVAVFVKKSTVKKTKVSCKSFWNSKQGRDMIIYEGKVGTKNINVFTSHLESTRECAEDRKFQLKQVFDEMLSVDPSHTVVFGADTNLRDYEVADVMKYDNKYNSQIKDVWEMIGRPQDARYSWDLQKNDNQIKGGKARLRFERLYTRSLTPSSDEIFKPVEMTFVGTSRLAYCGLFPSDHWGIFTTFKC